MVYKKYLFNFPHNCTLIFIIIEFEVNKFSACPSEQGNMLVLVCSNCMYTTAAVYVVSYTFRQMLFLKSSGGIEPNFILKLQQSHKV